jgi:predicted phage tail protein
VKPKRNRQLELIRGRKGGKGGGGGVQYAPYEAPNTLRSKQTARIVDLISEGEIGGLVNGAQSIYFDETPLQNPDGTFNFQGVSFEQRVGLPAQDHIPGFASAETEVPVGVEITVAGGPIVRTVTDPDADGVRIKIRVPNLSLFDTASNSLLGAAVAIQIEVAPDGGPFVVALQDTISGKTTSPYEREYRVELPAGGNPWSVRVSRLTPDAVSTTLQDKTFWGSYTIVTDAKFSYPDSALIGMVVDAEQFGSNVPTRGYEVNGLKIQVPSNYDPVTRIYTGIWDGTFQVAFSDNPAWVLYDIMTSARYGLGDYLVEADIDKFALYAIAQYCDELVPDGAGGTEPRFIFNGVINDQREAYQVLNTLASSFQGILYWSSGAVSVSQDAPADPVKLVTPANVIGGTFDYSGSSLKARHTVIYVTWNDPELGYRTSIEVIEDFDAIAQFGIRKKDVVAYGCTSRSQAKRYGRWILDSERYSTEAVRYQAGLDHADVRPGDLVAIADPTIAGARLGGRIVSFPTPGVTVELDDEVTIEAGETYQLSFYLDDGTVVDVDVTDGPGTYTTLTMASDPGTVLVGGIWILTASNVEPRQFRILSVTEAEKHRFEIEGVLHDPTKYARIEQNLRLEPPDFTLLPTGPLPAPTGLAVQEFLFQINGVVKSAATFSWERSPDGRVSFYEAEVQRPGSASFEALGIVSSVSVDLQDTQPGQYIFRVRALSYLGQKSPFTTFSPFLFGLAGPPADVTGFQVDTVIDDSAFLSWDPNSDLDLAGYVIRYHPSRISPVWNEGTILSTVGSGTTSAVVPALPGTYMIKAFDSFGSESVNPALASASSEQLPLTNIVIEFYENPDFLGPKTDVGVVNDKLQLIDGGNTLSTWVPSLSSVISMSLGVGGGLPPEGTYVYDNNTVDLGEAYEVRVENILEFLAENAANVMATWVPLSTANPLSGVAATDIDVIVEIRTTNDDPGGSPTWSAWMPLGVIGTFVGRAFEFRVRLLSYNSLSTPLVCVLGIRIGMSDRVEQAENVTSPAPGPTTFTFTYPFYSTPSVQITGLSLPAGVIAELTNVDRFGFDLRFLDSGGTPVAAQFDWTANGFGRQEP